MQCVVLRERTWIFPGRASVKVEAVALLEGDSGTATKVLFEEASKVGLPTAEDSVVVSDHPTEKVRLRVEEIPDLNGGLPGYLSRVASSRSR